MILKSSFHCFELVSGLNINWSKSHLLGLSLSDSEYSDMTNILGCSNKDWPTNTWDYHWEVLLGKKSFWDLILDKYRQRLARGKANYLSFGRILTLINATPSNLQYIIQRYLESQRVLPQILKDYKKQFLCRGQEASKPHLIIWRTVE